MKLQSIKIDLYTEKISLELNINEIWEELGNLKETIKEIDNLKNENKEKDNRINDLINEIKELKNEINYLKNEDKEKENNILTNDKNGLKREIDILKNENKELIKKYEEINKEINDIKDSKSDYSIIMNGYDKSFIFYEIENKINKKIKKMKKLYQATIDGGDTINFHNKCDNIPNTLVLILSEGHRRFGGFTPIPWKSKGDFIDDPEMKTFVFSLDNQNIYYLKDNGKNAVYHHHETGPCFGSGHDISIEGNPIKENKLFTFQSSFEYNGGNNPLSEYI